jgi:DNA-directed RNA polymerase beta subunit
MALLDDILCNVKQAAPSVLPSVEPPQPLPLQPVAPITHRAFGDNKTMRESIFNNVLDTLSKAYPIENTRYRLELKNVGLDSKDSFSLAEQKKAILQGKSLERKITGEWQLFDKTTNQLVDKKAATIAHVPYATDRGTFIYRGNEYTVANQMRLRPGVFTRVKDNGTLEAHVNVKSGTGPSFRVYMEPQTGIFRLKVGQSTLKMYPILRAMGVQDRDMRNYWGNELLQQNIAADDPGAVSRAFISLVNRRDLQEDVQSEQKANSEALQLNEESQQLKAAEDRKHALEKEAKIGAKESDRKWQKLWYRGRLRAEAGKDNKPWVYLDVHRGLVDAAFDSLKDQGMECERTPNAAHITVVRSSEADELISKHGPIKWKGVAKDGMPVRFALNRMVSLSPEGWKDIDRVWFLEVDSPDLQKYRKELGLSPLPISEETGHEFRFHITFAVHRPSTTIKRAEYLFGCKRAAAATGEGFTLGSPANEHGKGLLEVFNKMELDEDTTDLTLGGRYKNAGPEVLLRTSQKLLNIFNKKEEVDDRDSLAFQTLHSPEDFFAERIKKDAGQLGRKLLWRSTLRGNVQHVPTGALTPQLYSVLLKSGMGMPVEEVNPFELYDQNLRILRLGEGGIGNLDAVPSEARNVQPSQFGFIDPVRAPESEKIGVDSRVAEGVVRGSDGQFYASLRNAKTGRPELVSAVQAASSTVAFPGEMAKDTPKVRAMVRSRQVQYVDRDKVDFELPKASQMFTASSNMTPMISGIKGGRLLMGAKYVIQSLPLQQPEAPLVQNLVGDDTDESFDEKFGTRVGALRARDRGVVTDIGKDHIQVRYADGTKENHELYQNFPFNRKTFLHNTPVVNVGDQIKPNQLLAKSNYTDDKGVVAMGNNLRVAYLPYQGLNYEDAIVISESASKMMSSEHMYQHEIEGDPNIITGRNQYVSIFPSQFDKKQLSAIDAKGVAKVGSVVKYGDPLILSLNKAKPTAVHRGHKAMFSDGAITWDHESDGVVTDVDKTREGGYNVTVKAYMPAREGDKLAGRYGDKGVISKIIPDDQMVHDKDGKPYQILLNPLGIISRGNPSQIHEALLGKIARKRGKAYKVPGFMEGSMVDFVKKELQDAGMKDTEDLFDPATGKKIKDILTGERFIYKLHHTAESKGRGRDVGAYTSEGLPAKGGEFGAKRISNMEINSLLSHGATEVLRDAQTVRGQRNDDYWRAFRLGLTPPSPKVPFVYDKFLTHLKGAGINIKKDGERLQLFAMTDKDVDKLSAGPLSSAKTVGGDKLEEIAGGLFDRGLTGGHGGSRWAHVQLSEPIPNPVMEEPIRRLLNLTQNQYEQWIAGKVAYKGKYGGEAIHKALSDINLDDSIRNNEEIIREGPRTKRDKAVKVLGYLKNMKKNNLRPEDWVMNKVPVIPPSFRPIGKYRDMPLVADANMLYQDLIHSNDVLKEIRGVVDVDSSSDERLQVYNAFKAVSGLGDPIQAKNKEKQVKGLLKHVFGTSPKLGMFQRRVLGAPVDIVGRATITPNPDLSMDQVGLPEPKAWTIYRPFIMRRLVREGMPALAAAQAVAAQTPVARKALVAETQARPVLINRAPTLHRYGFMAAWPVLTKGETLQISPVVTAGFNADFDGDAMNYHVPVTDGAVSDAINKMLPSKNLKSSSNFKVHYLPRQEFLMGLHLASTAKKDTPPRVFASKEDVIKAYNRGDISLGDSVIVK